MMKKETVSTALKADKEQWEKLAQTGEFDYHVNNKWRQSDDFMGQTHKLFDYFGFTPTSYSNKVVLDLGAGSKLRTKYFESAKIIAVEPLASKFMDTISWSDLKDAYKVFSEPAENLIPECVGAADLVISINVLDHCFDFEVIVKNIFAYLKPGGYAFLSFDSHDVADEMHPLLLTKEICDSYFSDIGFQVEYYTQGFGGVIPENTYGHGPFALNYGLRKPN